MYLTQEELIEHRSATHDKIPQQPQSAQSGDTEDSVPVQGTSQDNGDTSVNDPSASEEAPVIGEIVSSKNGSFSMDGNLERNRRKVGSVHCYELTYVVAMVAGNETDVQLLESRAPVKWHHTLSDVQGDLPCNVHSVCTILYTPCKVRTFTALECTVWGFVWENAHLTFP